MKKIIHILRCPICFESLSEMAQTLSCPQGHAFPLSGLVPTLLPTAEMQSADWHLWEVKQKLGEEDYEHPDPEYLRQSNIIARLFGEFCGFQGSVLDIGCGIHPQLAYVKNDVYSQCFYVGVDPLPGSTDRPYHFVRAIAERLPFHDKLFDQVILATSLDHIINVDTVLSEILRVLKPSGIVNLWITVIERIPTRDITIYSWLKDVLFQLSRFRWRAALYNFVVPYSMKGQNYNTTDKYHFHRFTRSDIERLFSTHGFLNTDNIFLEMPPNPDSKHLFAKFRKRGDVV